MPEARRSAARQSDAFRAHVARGGAAGRAGQGHRRRRRGQDRRHHRPARFLLDTARRLRQSAGPAADLRPGVSRLLAQPGSAEEDDGARAAGDADRRCRGRGRGDGAAPRRGAAPGHRQRGRNRGDRDRDRRGDELLRPRAAARHGFREDVTRRAGPRQGGDREAAPAGAGRPDPALRAGPRAAPAPICARPCARRCARAGSSS